jgi:hypothetical protein
MDPGYTRRLPLRNSIALAAQDSQLRAAVALAAGDFT